MLKVPHAVLEDIRRQSDIATVIGSYFALQRSGSALKALCPFHKEKTPSFIVNPQRQIFHCFGCGAGGDVFRFVMDYEKVDFMSAIKMLADRAGIRLRLESAGGEADPSGKQPLFALLAAAAKWYHEQLLQGAEGEPARRYLAARDLPSQAVETFQIGFAPNRWDALLAWAARAKISRQHLEAAGLIIPAQPRGDAPPRAGEATRWYDRFRNRLMFPIRDEQGRVVGFSGRLLDDEPGAAKYVNTPETPLFRKGRLLYALHQARRAIVEAREAIVCEGQIDVIRCHLAGFATAVAAQGTAFTADHALLLKRYADSVVLVFDADRAGQDAALRAADAFLQVGLAVRVAALPEDEDPDSLIRKPGGADRFRACLDRAVPALEFQLEVLARRERLDTEAGLMRVAAAAVALIARTPNPVQQAAMIRRAAARLALPESALERQLAALHKARGRRAAEPPPAAESPAERPAREIALVEHVAANLALADLVRAYLPLDRLQDNPCRQALQACLRAHAEHRELMPLVADLDDEARSLSRFLAAILAAPPKIKSDFATDEDSVKSLILAIHTAALRRRRLDLERQRQARQLAAPAAAGAPAPDALDLEYTQLLYDLAKFKDWETALPVMDLLAAPESAAPESA